MRKIKKNRKYVKYIALYSCIFLFGIFMAFNFRPNEVDPSNYVGEHYANFMKANNANLYIQDDIKDDKFEFDVAGLYKPIFKHIIIDKQHFEWAFYHEYGHLVADVNGDIDESKEFMEIFELEKDNLTLENYEYAKTNSNEYFACTFNNYVKEPDKLKEQVPLTYYFIDSIKNK